MIWKFSDDRPVYQQIIEIIQDSVLSGRFPAGSKIPSVRELAADARVNPNTMQHALQELEGQKLLITNGTSGRFVTEDSQIIESAKQQRIQALIQEYIKKLSALGISPKQAADYLTEIQKGKD